MNYRGYHKEKTPRRSHAMGVLDFLVLLITLVLSVLLALAFLAPHVNPNGGWLFALLGLGWPVLYIANVVAALYWVLRWKKYVFVPLLILVVSAGYTSLFFRPSVRKHYAGQDVKPAFTVMSYNVEGFLDSDNDRAPVMDSTAAYINSLNPDIICIQEFQVSDQMPRAHIDALLGSMPYSVSHYSITSTSSAYGWGVAIYSRYKIISSTPVKFSNSSNYSIVADMVVGSDTLRVLNCHLQSTTLTSADRNFMTPEQFLQYDSEQKKEHTRNILRKLRDNYRKRAIQADSIAGLIAVSPYPVIVCGDFNDTPVSYAYRRVRGELMDAFVEKGRGSSNTFRGFYNLFRIDYILYDKRLEAVMYHSPESEISDHYPVIAGFNFRK